MKVYRYGDDVNTDQLFPGKYTYQASTPDEIRPHLLEDLDRSFAGAVRPGDVILAGKNFGCGSSREQPVVGLKAVGIRAVVAKGFARIFYRAAINQGLTLVACPAAVDAWAEGSAIAIDETAGRIRVGEAEFAFPPLPPEVLAIREAGGLLAYTRKMLEAGR